MAYTLFPTTTGEIIAKCRSNPDRCADIVELFNYLSKKFKQVTTPINIDVQTLGMVNVSRELQGMIETKDIVQEVGLKKIKIKFGAGSAGNRGVKNRGNLFENTFAKAIRDSWDSQKKSINPAIAKAVDNLAEIYHFDKLKGLIVKEEGAMNVKRPLKFQPGPYITSPTNTLDIGKTVTDLTLHEAKNISQARPSNVVGYLSLKLGGTTTFFNIGIRTILTPDEIKTGTVRNADGIRLLKMLGIDNQTFCKIFNGRLKKGIKTNTFGTANRRYLETFLQSGIGYGFCVVHQLNANKIKTFKIDKQYMQRAAKPMSCDVYYGGKTGTGKRVDIEIKTPLYLFKLNMRDTQGKDGYPTRLMGDFTYRQL